MIYLLQNLIKTLPEEQSTNSSHFKDSSLNKILMDYLGGDTKMTLVVAIDGNTGGYEDAVKLGAKAKLIKNYPTMNKIGLNAKRKMDLLVQDMNVKEQNYLAKINLLQTEIKTLKTENDSTTNSTSNSLENALQENSKLKLQLESLQQILGTMSLANPSSSNKNEMNEHDELLKKLMSTCEDVANLQLSVDNGKHINRKLKKQIDANSSKEDVFETMNSTLLKQIQNQEKELEELLTANASLQIEFENLRKVSNSRKERITHLEKILKDLQNHNVQSSSPGKSPKHLPSKLATKVDSNSPQNHSLFKTSSKTSSSSTSNSNSNLNANTSWSVRKASTATITSTTSQDSHTARPIKRGINLHSVRVVSESTIVPEHSP